ncbi:MAG: MarR family winged helix-turn-helix transcriptional regulator [Galactobacter sp.]
MSEHDETPSTGAALLALMTGVYAINRFASSRTPGHSPTHYRVLALLKDHGSYRVGDLAAQVHLSQPGMTKTVNLLAELGFVEKGPDPSDSRATLVSLTDAGEDALTERTKDVVRTVLPGLGEFSEAERRTLWDAAQLLATHLDAGAHPPTDTAKGPETTETE